jgi:kinetochore protein Spc25, fungi type
MNMASATTSFTPSHPFPTSMSSRAAAPMSPQPNPLTQLPNVDFNFEDLRQRMSAFTVKFDAFIERGRKRVLEERNEFRERLGELAGTSTIVVPIHFRTR